MEPHRVPSNRLCREVGNHPRSRSALAAAATAAAALALWHAFSKSDRGLGDSFCGAGDRSLGSSTISAGFAFGNVVMTDEGYDDQKISIHK